MCCDLRNEDLGPQEVGYDLVLQLEGVTTSNGAKPQEIVECRPRDVVLIEYGHRLRESNRRRGCCDR